MRKDALLTLLAALALASCGKADNDSGPGGVSVGEAKALDEAAEMLDAQRLPATATAPATAKAGQPATAAQQ